MSDSGVRADPPGNAIEAAAKAVHERRCTWTTSKSEREYGALDREIAVAALAAAAPVIAAQVRAEADALIVQAEDHARQEEERFEIVMADFVADLPPCPNCGCRTSDEADCRDCGCDTGCNDGDWHPGVNVIAAQAARDERQRIYEWLLARETELIHPETAEEVAAVRWRDIADLLLGAESHNEIPIRKEGS